MTMNKQYALMSPEEKVLYVQELIHKYNFDSLNRIINSEDGDAIELGDMLQEGSPPVDEIVIENCQRDTLKMYISKLSPREQVVLSLRFGLNDDVEHTLEEIGTIFNVTRERVRQVERQALAALKRKLINANINSISDL